MSYKLYFLFNFAQNNPFTKFDSFSSNISVYEHANKAHIRTEGLIFHSYQDERKSFKEFESFKKSWNKVWVPPFKTIKYCFDNNSISLTFWIANKTTFSIRTRFLSYTVLKPWRTFWNEVFAQFIKFLNVFVMIYSSMNFWKTQYGSSLELKITSPLLGVTHTSNLEYDLSFRVKIH